MKNKNIAYKNILKDYQDILDINDLCKILRVSKKTVYSILQDGTIKSFKVGRSYRILKTYLLEYFDIIEN